MPGNDSEQRFLNQPTVIGTFIGNDEVPAWSEDVIRMKSRWKG